MIDKEVYHKIEKEVHNNDSPLGIDPTKHISPS
ncbi:hypothetical protein JoomaDRAFT_0576 [Galbibacter orientalis DSM 19592]|uniref:Uncharacterized protein n=1 Tax=Galbibacter orientalis DSM 19592 TaxID=926559 RepID=I3C1X4_9FLAO|nr:hypothetical protein JoomaDRAFT_0576 [Galbibacter orientalis DSM 19592]